MEIQMYKFPITAAVAIPEGISTLMKQEIKTVIFYNNSFDVGRNAYLWKKKNEGISLLDIICRNKFQMDDEM